MFRLLFVMMCCLVLSCVADKPLEKVTAASSIPPKAKPEIEASPKAVKPIAAEPIPTEAPMLDCQTLPSGITLPYYLSSASVFVISFLKPCRTADGRDGFQRGSSWTAMGFPCTAGRGRIDKKGSENVPSVVTFHLQNSCPMQPGRPDDVESMVRQKLGLPADSRLIAYYPLSVDYWELLDYVERDIGHRPEIFAPLSISNGWQKFSTKSEAIKIRLYGRENAWEPGKKLYEIEAQILPEGRSTFRLQVQAARSLDEQGKAAVRERCDSLRPKRSCEEVFGL